MLCPLIAGAQEASLAVVHARVWTGNVAHHWAEALATNGDTILAVASDFLLAQIQMQDVAGNPINTVYGWRR